MEFLEAGRRQGTLSAFSLDRASLGNVTVFAHGFVWLVLPFVLLACHDGEMPPQVEAYASSNAHFIMASVDHRVTGHSDGGTATLALALLDRTKHVPAAIAPSAAGWTKKDLEAYQCRDPLPIMIMHGKNDRLFPGWGAQTAAWWAACNHTVV